MRGAAVVGVLAAAMWLACGNDYGDENAAPPAQGERSGKCYPNGTCNAGLLCFDNVCVMPEADGGTSSSSSGDSGASSSGGAALSLTAYAQAVCALQKRCSPKLYATSFADDSACFAVYSRAPFEGDYPGLARPTQAQLDACTSALTARKSCAPDAADVPECRFPGTAADGAPCNFDAQCKSGLCPQGPNNGCATCMSLGTANSPCATSANCAHDFFCDGIQCQTRRNGDEVCLSTNTNTCVAGLVCTGGQCRVGRELGAECQSTDQCRTGLVCPDAALKCEERQYATLGDSCGGNLPCALAAACVTIAGQKMVCLAYAKEREQCGKDGLAPCDLGLVCTQNLCAKPAVCK